MSDFIRRTIAGFCRSVVEWSDFSGGVGSALHVKFSLFKVFVSTLPYSARGPLAVGKKLPEIFSN